jgi:hypothetical protein
MELIKKYLDDVMKVDGKWMLQVPDSITQEQLHHIHDNWKSMYPDDHLIIMPKDITIHKLNKYSFYIAMMLVKMGHRITRLEWARPYSTMRHAPVLMLEEVEGADEKILIRRFPDGSEEDEFFFVGSNDMDADDYVLAPKGD